MRMPPEITPGTCPPGAAEEQSGPPPPCPKCGASRDPRDTDRWCVGCRGRGRIVEVWAAWHASDRRDLLRRRFPEWAAIAERSCQLFGHPEFVAGTWARL